MRIAEISIWLCYSLLANRSLSTQDEYKKLEDSEKKSREGLGGKTEGLFWNADEQTERRENPESQKLNIEMDEL